MTRAQRDGFGTALGPYGGADLAEWHLEMLAEEASQARLVNAAGKRTAEPQAPRRKAHVHWHHRASHAH